MEIISISVARASETNVYININERGWEVMPSTPQTHSFYRRELRLYQHWSFYKGMRHKLALGDIFHFTENAVSTATDAPENIDTYANKKEAA